MSASAKGTAEAPGQRVKQKAGLNQSILDASFGELRRQLAYKCHWHGRVLLVVDRWAPTSKTCSGCGAVQAEMPLQIRDWTCPACGAVHDRDVNAAMNVLRFATGGEPGGDARGGWTPPSAGVDGDPGVLAPDETRTKPKAVTKHPGRCAAAA